MKKTRKVKARKVKEKSYPKPTIEFCKKCGSIMLPEKKTKNVYLKCRSCGYELKKNVRSMRLVKEKESREGIVVLEKNEIMLPVTERICPKCDNNKAYYWLQQTRSADEPPTQFFRCTKCKHVWREYK